MTTITSSREVRDATQAIAARTAIITLRLRKPSTRRQARDGDVKVVSATGEGDPEEDSTAVSLELLRAESYKEICAHDRGTRDVLKVASLPAGRRLVSGSFLVPVASVERIYDRLGARAVERSVLVGAFCDAYPAIVADAHARLRDAFDVRMFPGVEMQGAAPVVVSTSEIRAAFAMDYELEVADREAGIRAAGKTLSASFVEREMKRARDSSEALLSEMRDGLRVAFAELVDRATSMLTPAAEGERRVFRGESLEKIDAFLGAFAERNVAGDGDLAAVVAKAREVLRGVSPEDLKGAKAKTERETLGRTLAGIQEQLAPLVATTTAARAATIAKPRRRVVLSGDV